MKTNDTSIFQQNDECNAMLCGAQDSAPAPAARAMRAPRNLTVKDVEAAKPGDTLTDALVPGLHLQVTSRKTWKLTFTPPGAARTKRTRMKLGTYPAMPLGSVAERTGARWKAIEMRALLEAGIDPRIAPAPTKAPMTMAQLIEERLANEVRGKLDTAKDTERRYTKDVLPLVGDLPIKDFRREHLNRVLEPIRARGSLRSAGMVFADLRALFNYAVAEEHLEFSPVGKVKATKLRVSLGNVRERNLSLEEIRAVWKLLPGTMAKTDNVPLILKLCLVTGQRLSEVAGMCRDNLDMAKQEWLIPDTKNGHDHLVPLSDLAMGLIRDALRETNGNYLFPNRAGDGPLQHFAIDQTLSRVQKARPDMPLGKLCMPRWMPHDLRRTMATQMSTEGNGMDIPELYISHVLNHRSVTKHGVTKRHYIKNTYVREKREALDKWGAFLTQLVSAESIQQAA